MRVILLERVRNLGNIGQEVTVKDGYGRNFLLPQNKALRATEKNKKFFEDQKAAYEAKNKNKRQIAEKMVDELRNFALEITASAQSNGKLYGSITVRDLALHFQEKGKMIERAHIAMPKPISETGVYFVQILPHPEVTTEIKVVVGSTQEEVNMLQKTPEELAMEEKQYTISEKQEEAIAEENAKVETAE